MSMATSHYARKTPDGPHNIFSRKTKKRDTVGIKGDNRNKMNFDTTYRDQYDIPVSLPAINLSYKRDPLHYR